ncbi:hypothetical protein SCOCK_50194 [Actinacidiphila cocklensis]|uniref:Uncharacterized protein n=1 Tax=Actinacidiphila cocklensis TaxID=887465 RepID=A0A9W4DVK0_9ACTN|nr:hypothetical protein SCOCK_50194 [Actinacidiphila cocklensis]
MRRFHSVTTGRRRPPRSTPLPWSDSDRFRQCHHLHGAVLRRLCGYAGERRFLRTSARQRDVRGLLRRGMGITSTVYSTV